MKKTPLFSNVSSCSSAALSRFAEIFDEPMREKLLLVLNHVVARNSEAQEKLRVHTGCYIMLDMPAAWVLKVTPAGLFEEALPESASLEEGALPSIDLYLRVKNKNPLELMGFVLKGQCPPVDIEGDADLAAVFAWLVEHVRWNYREELSSVAGGKPVHLGVEQLRMGADFLKNLLGSFAQHKKNQNSRL